MTNKELGEFISHKNFKETSDSLLKRTEEIMGAGLDLVTSFFLASPSYSLLKPFIDHLSDWKSRVELKQLAYFLNEFDDLNQSERSDFSLMIQSNNEDFTERLFYYVSQYNDKRKSKIGGRLGVAFARKKIDPDMFFSLIQRIKDLPYVDLLLLKNFVENNGLHRRIGSDEQYEKMFFLSSLSFISIDFTAEQRSTLISNGFLTEQYKWRELGRTDDVKKLEGVLNAIRKLKPEYTLTEVSYFLYKYGLLDEITRES